MGVRLRKDESHLLPFRVFQARPSCRVLGENRFLNCAKGSPNFKPLKSARATSASHDCAAAVPDKASKIKHNIRFMVISCPVRFMWIIQAVGSFFYIQPHTAAGVFQTAFFTYIRSVSSASMSRRPLRRVSLRLQAAAKACLPPTKVNFSRARVMAV